MKAEPSICPLCNGDGKRRYGRFVNDEETCRACGGKGIVWPPSAYYPQPAPLVPMPQPYPVPVPYSPPWNPIWPPRVWCTVSVDGESLTAWNRESELSTLGALLG